MEWYALYIDGELQAVRKWFGTPKVSDFGVASCPNVHYYIVKAFEQDNIIHIKLDSYSIMD
jgi:hypothetical protein